MLKRISCGLALLALVLTTTHTLADEHEPVFEVPKEPPIVILDPCEGVTEARGLCGLFAAWTLAARSAIAVTYLAPATVGIGIERMCPEGDYVDRATVGDRITRSPTHYPRQPQCRIVTAQPVPTPQT